MRVFISVFLLFLLTSCSGYFSKSMITSDHANLLAKTTGGTLSQSGYQEISPFLYRGINGQNPVLFYAGNQGGNYDIYFAKMNTDGIFLPPVPLGNQINTAADESFPLVYHDSGALIISFIRYTNNEYRLNTYQLSNDVTFDFKENNQNDVITNDLTGMSLRRNSLQNAGNLVIYYGADNSMEPYWSGYQTGWDIYSSSIKSNPDSLLVYSGSEFATNIMQYAMKSYLLEVKNQGRSQFHVYGIVEDTTSTPITLDSSSEIPEVYSSTYNDKHAFVDWFDPDQQYKVYFSSERMAGGDFDLYRYNVNTFLAVSPYIPYLQYLNEKGFTN